jgi:hypothetical protein
MDSAALLLIDEIFFRLRLSLCIRYLVSDVHSVDPGGHHMVW